ncbi:MAG: YbgA family protein [Acidobacteriia bacterium]|nr:YbgA family protein [Terriglobia bacterium]
MTPIASHRCRRELGRIVANGDGKRIVYVLDLYGKSFRGAFHKPPRHASPINVPMHALGYFKKELSAREKRHFLSVCETYRRGKTPLSSAPGILSHSLRFRIPARANVLPSLSRGLHGLGRFGQGPRLTGNPP